MRQNRINYDILNERDILFGGALVDIVYLRISSTLLGNPLSRCVKASPKSISNNHATRSPIAAKSPCVPPTCQPYPRHQTPPTSTNLQPQDEEQRDGSSFPCRCDRCSPAVHITLRLAIACCQCNVEVCLVYTP